MWRQASGMLLRTMSDSTESLYRRRIERVLSYIEEHYDTELDVETLSKVAGFSRFHFHRQFAEYVGISAARYVAMLRLRNASMQLAMDEEQRIVDIAIAAGFDSHEAFSRAFKRVLGQSPSSFRKAPQWEHWANIFERPIRERIEQMTTNKDAFDVQIVDVPHIKVAVLEHIGPPEKIMESVQRFIAWRKTSKDSPEADTMTIGVPYGAPATKAPEEFRFDICSEAPRGVSDNDAGVVEKEIPGGRCAVVRHLGSTDAIAATVHKLYGEWLPQSGEELRDFPVYFHYIERMPRVREHKQVTDVYLPLR